MCKKMVEAVLVTGASGFIGRQTVSSLEKAGLHVIRGVRRPEGEGGLSNFVKIDLNDPSQILSLKDNLRCDAIVHLGALVGLTGETDAELFVPNVLSTGCIACLAKYWDAHLVFASTAMVHGMNAERIQVGSPLNPDTPYGRSKMLAEQLLQASGVKCCILRIAGVFGLNGPDHLGLNRAIASALHGKPPVQIGSGQALRNYVYVKDVAEIITYAIKMDLTGVHLVAGHQLTSVSQMLQLVCDTYLPGKQPFIIDGPEATDQIVTPSTALPKTRSFHDALIDIQEEFSF